MPLGVLITGEVKQLICEAVEKSTRPQLRRGTGCARPESVVEDLKPDDLCLGSLKPSENWVEERTGIDVQIIRKTWV